MQTEHQAWQSCIGVSLLRCFAVVLLELLCLFRLHVSFVGFSFLCLFVTWLFQVVKTEYQARQTPHWHIALWVSLHAAPSDIVGDSKDTVRSSFVRWLEEVFGASQRCEAINVQIPPGGGRLNYINGYVSKVFLLGAFDSLSFL